MLIFGIDEVGRGAVAGPLVLVCVALNDSFLQGSIKDSKLLTPKKRFQLFPLIIKHSYFVKFVFIKHTTIDNLGLAEAYRLALTKLLRFIFVKFENKSKLIIVDGNKVKVDLPYKLKKRVYFLKKADKRFYSVSCASIVAKVVRDSFMMHLHKINDNIKPYDFYKNKGYLTKQHIKTIKSKGITSYHRRSYLYGWISSLQNTIYR